MVEPVDDVELFLAELRLSSMTQPTLNISNAARYEFIVNLLITEVGTTLDGCILLLYVKW